MKMKYKSSCVWGKMQTGKREQGHLRNSGNYLLVEKAVVEEGEHGAECHMNDTNNDGELHLERVDEG